MLTMQTDEFLDAVKKNESPRIRQLLEAQPSLAKARDKDGVSAVLLALYRGNKQAAQEIGSRKPDLDVFEAAAMGIMSQLKTLVDHDVSLVRSYSPDGFTALALASYLGQKESAEYLLDKGADLDASAKERDGIHSANGCRLAESQRSREATTQERCKRQSSIRRRIYALDACSIRRER